MATSGTEPKPTAADLMEAKKQRKATDDQLQAMVNRILFLQGEEHRLDKDIEAMRLRVQQMLSSKSEKLSKVAGRGVTELLKATAQEVVQVLQEKSKAAPRVHQRKAPGVHAASIMRSQAGKTPKSTSPETAAATCKPAFPASSGPRSAGTEQGHAPQHSSQLQQQQQQQVGMDVGERQGSGRTLSARSSKAGSGHSGCTSIECSSMSGNSSSGAVSTSGSMESKLRCSTNGESASSTAQAAAPATASSGSAGASGGCLGRAAGGTSSSGKATDDGIAGPWSRATGMGASMVLLSGGLVPRAAAEGPSGAGGGPPPWAVQPAGGPNCMEVLDKGVVWTCSPPCGEQQQQKGAAGGEGRPVGRVVVQICSTQRKAAPPLPTPPPPLPVPSATLATAIAQWGCGNSSDSTTQQQQPRQKEGGTVRQLHPAPQEEGQREQPSSCRSFKGTGDPNLRVQVHGTGWGLPAAGSEPLYLHASACTVAAPQPVDLASAEQPTATGVGLTTTAGVEGAWDATAGAGGGVSSSHQAVCPTTNLIPTAGGGSGSPHRSPRPASTGSHSSSSSSSSSSSGGGRWAGPGTAAGMLPRSQSSGVGSTGSSRACPPPLPARASSSQRGSLLLQGGTSRSRGSGRSSQAGPHVQRRGSTSGHSGSIAADVAAAATAAATALAASLEGSTLGRELQQKREVWRLRKTFGLQPTLLRDPSAVVDDMGAGAWK